MRIRGELLAYLTAATGVSDGFLCAVGIGLASQNAFTDIGVTALMSPIGDEDWDGWLYHRFFNLHSASVITDVASSDQDTVNAVISPPLTSCKMQGIR